jgi:hypothetical protein
MLALRRYQGPVTIMECPGCRHSRDVHKDGNCYRLVEMVTAGGENHLTLCGYCAWAPIAMDNGTRGWRRVGVDPGQIEGSTVEGETLTAALAEIERIMARQ